MVKILEQPENQKPAMMDSSYERQSVGSSTGVCNGAGEPGTRLAKILMRRGCSIGVSHQGVVDSLREVESWAQTKRGLGRAERYSCLGGYVLRDNAVRTG